MKILEILWSILHIGKKIFLGSFFFFFFFINFYFKFDRKKKQKTFYWFVFLHFLNMFFQEK